MKRFLIFLSIFTSFSFVSFRPVSASGSLSVDLDPEIGLATITLNNYVGPEFNIDYDYVAIVYSGENIINLTTPAGLSAPSATGVSFAPQDTNAKLTINQPSSDPASLALDAPSAIFSAAGDNVLTINAPNSRVAVRAKSFMTSVSGFGGPNFEYYTIDFEKIVAISSLASEATPFSFGLPGTEIDADHFSYDQPGITYSYAVDGSVGTFSLLHEIRGVNARLDLDDLPEFASEAEAEQYLKSSLARDDNNPAIETDEIAVQTINPYYEIDLDNSYLLQAPQNRSANSLRNADSSEATPYLFRLTFKSTNKKYGFTNLSGFCPISCLVLNGKTSDDSVYSRLRSSDGYSESFDLPLTLKIQEKIIEDVEEIEEVAEIEKENIFAPRVPNTGRAGSLAALRRVRSYGE